MSLPRVFVGRLPGPGERVRLPAEESAHVRARRVEAGDRVVLFDGGGAEAVARAVRVSRSRVEVEVEGRVEPAPTGPEVSLSVAAVRLERLAWIAEKATELGAARLILLETRRTQPFRAAAAARGRLERVARAAAKQCGAARWPILSGPVPAAQAFAAETSKHRLLLDPGGAPFPPALAPAPAALAVGPEGGWTPEEIEIARRAGWTAARLPAGVLRTETAAVAGLVLLAAALSRGASDRGTSV